MMKAYWIRGTLTLKLNGKTVDIECPADEVSLTLAYIERKTKKTIFYEGPIIHGQKKE